MFKSINISFAFLLRFTADTLRYAVILTFDPMTLTCQAVTR